MFANLHIFENVLSVNVDGSSQSFSVESFGNQDALATTMIVEDNGDTLRMAGNTWKKLNLNYTITPNTMLEFDFASSQQGEVHALGFDTDDSVSGQRMFQLYGSDTWGIQAYRDYDPGHGTQHFVIPVGDSSQVRSTAWCWPTMTMPTRWAERICQPPYLRKRVVGECRGQPQSFSVESFGNQDALATTMIVEDNGDTLRMAGNTWKKLDLSYTITPNTVLEFDFASSQQGEVHAIGFDTDDSVSGQRMFQLYGSDTWGVQAYRDYDPGHGTQHFVIPVGDFFTGTFDRLVLANDDDADAFGASVFANLTVYEDSGDAAEGEPAAASMISRIRWPQTTASRPREEVSESRDTRLGVQGSHTSPHVAVDLLLAGVIPPPADAVGAAADEVFSQHEDSELESLLDDDAWLESLP